MSAFVCDIEHQIQFHTAQLWMLSTIWVTADKKKSQQKTKQFYNKQHDIHKK